MVEKMKSPIQTLTQPQFHSLPQRGPLFNSLVSIHPLSPLNICMHM